tara:strand:- start:178 stop:384 length:207 start_codon:yes stop_codon:yes gene_type:complete
MNMATKAMQTLLNYFSKSKETKKEEAAEKKLPARTYAKVEKEEGVKSTSAKKSTPAAKAATRKKKAGK